MYVFSFFRPLTMTAAAFSAETMNGILKSLPSVMGVLTNPGLTVTTLIPRGLSSIRRASRINDTADLLAQ